MPLENRAELAPKRKPEAGASPKHHGNFQGLELVCNDLLLRMNQHCVGKLIKCDETKSFEIFKWLRKLISYPSLRRGGWMDGEITKYRNRMK